MLKCGAHPAKKMEKFSLIAVSQRQPNDKAEHRHATTVVEKLASYLMRVSELEATELNLGSSSQLRPWPRASHCLLEKLCDSFHTATSQAP